MKTNLPVRVLLILLCLVLGASGCSIIAPERETITLRIAYREQDVNLQPLLDAYMRDNSFIKIEVIEGNAGSGAVEGALAEKKLDIIRDDRDALEYAASGQLLPLEDMLLSDDWKGIRSDFVPGTWEGLQIEGRQWGVPASADVFVVYINMDTAAALGVETPSLTWTVDDFLTLANALNAPEGTEANPGQHTWGFCTDSQDYDPVLFVYLLGGTLVDDVNKPTQPTLDAPATVEAVKWYADLINLYKIAPSNAVMSALFSRGASEAAVRGFCGMWLDMYSDRGGPANNQWTFNWRMQPLPAGKAQLRFGDEQGYYITAGSEHPEEALKLIRYLTDHWEAAGRGLPPRQSIASSAEYAREVGEDVVAAGISNIDSLIILPAQAGPIFMRLGELFLNAVAQVLAGADPEDALYQAQQELLPIFAE